jgi:AraC-like DNA-binding protein
MAVPGLRRRGPRGLRQVSEIATSYRDARLLAGDKLTNSSDPISSIALSLGYESESAFSKAFKRRMGCSPRKYTSQNSPASPLRRRVEAAHTDGTKLSQVENQMSLDTYSA